MVVWLGAFCASAAVTARLKAKFATNRAVLIPILGMTNLPMRQRKARQEVSGHDTEASVAAIGAGYPCEPSANPADVLLPLRYPVLPLRGAASRDIVSEWLP